MSAPDPGSASPELDRGSLLDAALDAIISVDRTGRVLEFNPSAERTFGWTREQALGRDVGALIVPERYRDRHQAGLARVAAGGQRHITDRRVAVEGRRANGTEFPAELTVTVSSTDPFVATAFIRDVTDRHELENRLRHLADHDALTGLANRRRFEAVLAQHLHDPPRAGALIVLDLDHFKFVNDSFGHASGDRLIRAIAEVLGDAVGGHRVLARLSGDEFAVFLPGDDEAAAMELAHALVARVEAARPSGVRITASAGVACTAGDLLSPADLLVAADIALYQAKDQGRGRVAAYGGAPGQSLAWVERVRAALSRDDLVLYSQPIVDLASRAPVHEELLVRMRDERGRILPPGAFMPAAESFGLVGDIDSWVLRRGVLLAAAGRHVHVNVSAPSLGSAELVEVLSRDLGAAGADPSRIVIEITETAAVANMAGARRFVEDVRALGCGVALDDFGTGFGSLAYLKHLPADYLKLDLEFVTQVATNAADRQIVELCSDIARRFGQRTVAEGVEDEACVTALRDIGVELAQGYHLGRPAPVG